MSNKKTNITDMNKDFNCMTGEELELFKRQIDTALLTLRRAVRRNNEDPLKNDGYSKLLTMSIDVDREIMIRKESE